MRMFQILAITFIAAVMGIASTNSFLSLALAQPIVGVITYCHNEKSGTNFIGPCPGQSSEHNKNLQQKNAFQVQFQLLPANPTLNTEGK